MHVVTTGDERSEFNNQQLDMDFFLPTQSTTV